MDEVREWLMQAPFSAVSFMSGILVGELIAKTLEPEIAMLADLIRAFIGLR